MRFYDYTHYMDEKTEDSDSNRADQTTKLQDKWKTWDSSPGNLALEPLLLITLQYHTLSKEMITIHHRWWVPLLFFLAMY